MRAAPLTVTEQHTHEINAAIKSRAGGKDRSYLLHSFTALIDLHTWRGIEVARLGIVRYVVGCDSGLHDYSLDRKDGLEAALPNAVVEGVRRHSADLTTVHVRRNPERETQYVYIHTYICIYIYVVMDR